MLADDFDDCSWPDAERNQYGAVRTIGETLEELMAQYQGLFPEVNVGGREETVGVG